MATIQSPQQQRVVLHDISWETYERLLEGGRYVPDARSRVLPVISADAVSRLLEEGKAEGISLIHLMRRVRAWSWTLVEETES